MYMGIDACKVSYGKKQLSSWQITPNTVETTAVMPATDTKSWGITIACPIKTKSM
jgi:hypothetical protein